ncbi:major facilitator superfamily domain-containing protein [Lentinula detonsa]|uniref:Major facilitator superfamily domain-containing protein n=1 Tax=Lentinula detonsa TaxID=2804962 RepID=A0AA38UNC6_9AGAR|nr:major facilitator superfamily domain-containing protein [Lentinula detonsa]
MNSAAARGLASIEGGSPPATERTPLLQQCVVPSSPESVLDLSSPSLEAQKNLLDLKSKRETSPLPQAQLITLCLVRIVVPISFTQIFPYINEFIEFLGVTDSSQIGFFSGFVESSFAISQLLFIYHWARLSDRFGRRPIIIIGTLGVAVMTMVFGLANSIPELIVFRCLAGFFGATASVIHTVLGEITDSTNQAAAFPLYGITGPVGSIIGPLIGGSLSNPAQKFSQITHTPRLLTRLVLFLQRHPYFLPGLVSGIISLLGVALAYFCLDESLPSRRRPITQNGVEPHANSTSESELSDDPSFPKLPSARTLLSIPIIRALSLSGFALEMNGTSFVVLFVLFCYTPIEQGGLAFPPSVIGYALAFTGLVAGLTQLFLMPIFLRRFEAAKIYSVCMAVWPLVFLVLPCLNIIARYGSHYGLDGADGLDRVSGELGQLGNHTKAILWVGVFVALTLSRVGGIAYPASMILIKNNVPCPSYLGSTNGLVQWFMCLSRCVSAAFASSAFAVSAKYNILGGHFWAVLHALIAVGGWWLARDISLSSKSTLSS